MKWLQFQIIFDIRYLITTLSSLYIIIYLKFRRILKESASVSVALYCHISRTDKSEYNSANLIAFFKLLQFQQSLQDNVNFKAAAIQIKEQQLQLYI